MWLTIEKIFKRLSHDPNVRAIVLTGAGSRAFTAGLDVQAASQGVVAGAGTEKLDFSRKATALRRHIYEFQDCITAIEKCEKPVIAILHGFTYGLGIDISTACDIRLCAADTKFSVKEVDIGLAADIGTLTRLPKVVGNLSWIKDVAFTARPFGAEEALKQGFVSTVAASKDEAVKRGLELAALLAEKSPVAVQGTKELLNYSRDRPVEEGLRYTAVWNAAMVHSDDVKGAMLSGIQKRKPTFEKL